MNAHIDAIAHKMFGSPVLPPATYYAMLEKDRRLSYLGPYWRMLLRSLIQRHFTG